MRLAPRAGPLTVWQLIVPVAVGLAVLIFAAATFVAMDTPVWNGFVGMASGAFGSPLAVHAWLTTAGALILTGLATAVALRVGLNNFGAEGQYLAGALAAGALAATTAAWPVWAVFPLDLAAGALAGAVLMFAAAWLKLRRGVDEAIVTLLLNVVMLLAVRALVTPAGDGASTPMLAQSGVPPGLIIALAAAVSIAVATRWTVWGFALRALAGNAEAARFAGMPVRRMTMRVAIVSGALAGVAGVCQLASGGGVPHPGLGYAGIAVAILGALSPLGIVAAGFFVAAVVTGAELLVRAGAPAALPDLLVAFALLASLLGAAAVRHRMARAVEAEP